MGQTEGSIAPFNRVLRILQFQTKFVKGGL